MAGIEHVGDLLRILRERKGWTQEYLAHKMDVSISSISTVETGKQKPSWALIDKYTEQFPAYTQVIPLFTGTLPDDMARVVYENNDTEKVMEAAHAFILILEGTFSLYGGSQ